MDHGDAAGVLRRHAPLIGVLTLAGLVGALALVLLQSAMLPRHQATASFYVSTTASSVLSDVVPVGEDPQEGARPVDSFASVVTAPVVLRPVIARLGLPMTTAQLAQRVSTRTQAGISVLDVTVADASVGRAVRIADAIAARLLTVAPDLQPRGGPGTTTVRLTEVQRAHPVEPARRDVPLTLGSGALVGLTAGLVLAGLREPRRPAGWERLARP